MSINRIQKLLFSEYCEFEDMVLVESPFAETTRDGMGLRQVHLGLTPTKLVLATDVMPPAQTSSVNYVPGVDPDIETFELIAVYPIDCVNLSIFHRRKRQSIKARFCNNKILYFELGGFEKRQMFWNLWREKVTFLNPEEPGSSRSETSVATSTTNSTVYMVSSKRLINHAGNVQMWCQYAAGDFGRKPQHIPPPKWPDKHLYLGKNLDESPLQYSPGKTMPTIDEFVRKRKNKDEDNRVDPSMHNLSNLTGNTQVNRFSTGVDDHCSAGLFLPAENYLVRNKFSNFTTLSIDAFTMYKSPLSHPIDYMELAESSVRLWEFYKVTTSSMSTRGRHRRRYALAPQPHFYQGLGPWNVNYGERFSLQIKRAASVVTVRRQPLEPELRLSVSKRQLVASISCDTLYADEKMSHYNNTIRIPPKRPVIFFWTPEYWYRPRSAKDAYQELQKHLRKIRQYHQIRETFFSKMLTSKYANESYELDSDTSSYDRKHSDKKKQQKRRRHNIIISKIKPLPRKIMELITDRDYSERVGKETSLQFLRRVLKMNVPLSAWDFDSNTLAIQLTIIDKELFMKITPSELGVLVWQKSSKNAPNIGALIAFSHRISCLVTTEVLKRDSEKTRARLVARLINVAEKCNKVRNFQSCRTVLCGLQSPPIYRLYSTWSYLRKRHSTKYQAFEYLCRLYRDPRLQPYQKAFTLATRQSCYLPFIGDVIAKLLNRIPDYEGYNCDMDLGIKIAVNQKETDSAGDGKKEMPSLLKKILSSLRMRHSANERNIPYGDCSDLTSVVKKERCLNLVDYYKPLDCYEDVRQEKLNECVRLLEVYQKAASNYVYARNELAREYLLKARYREDKENFKMSFEVEPPLEIETNNYNRLE